MVHKNQTNLNKVSHGDEKLLREMNKTDKDWEKGSRRVKWRRKSKIKNQHECQYNVCILIKKYTYIYINISTLHKPTRSLSPVIIIYYILSNVVMGKTLECFWEKSIISFLSFQQTQSIARNRHRQKSVVELDSRISNVNRNLRALQYDVVKTTF